MNVLIMALGSRGDVQPYVALGTGLAKAEHKVRVLTFENFKDLVEAYGLEHVPVKGDATALVAAMSNELLSGSGRNPIADIKSIISAFGYLKEALPQALSSQLLSDTGAIINQLPASLFGYDAAQKYKIPYFAAAVMPLAPTRCFPNIFFPAGPAFLSGYNYFSHKLAEQMAWQPFRGGVNRWRKSILDLPSAPFGGHYRQMEQAAIPTLDGFSELVVARPPEWHSGHHFTGYWFLPEPDWSPSPDLQAFLESGSPPVFIGFGSMPIKDQAKLSGLVRQALQLVGQRGILSGGLGSNETKDKNVFGLDYAPYRWLFPRMKAIVHHGGAGTTASALYAGVPSMIVSFGGDQFYWGKRVQALGVGPAPIARRKLTPEKLAQAIHEMAINTPMQERAATLGEKLSVEDGIAKAVAVFERYVAKHSNRT